MQLYSSMPAAIAALEEDEMGARVIQLLKEMLKSRHEKMPDSYLTIILKRLKIMDKKPTQSASYPVVVVEGLDGVGKSTLCAGLARQMGAQQLQSPDLELLPLRRYFDQQVPSLRRAFYCLGNYLCALQVRKVSQKSPVVVDRFWASTAAYSMACDAENVQEVHMPCDLSDLLPHVTYLLLTLPEPERLERLRARERLGVAMTQEQRRLEENKVNERLRRAYGAVRVAGRPLLEVSASGAASEVLSRASHLLQQLPGSHVKPLSVNWHYTRACNYHCKFCFHTAKSSFFLPATEEGMAEAKCCLTRLRDKGMEKMNFSGGEPFLHAKELGELCRFCKQELALDSVSIVSNGSLIKRSWMARYGQYLDILAISCDSFVEPTNLQIGRGKGQHLTQLEAIRDWCKEFGIGFKINSVILADNVDEDMTEAIKRLQPIRWKVFQCLLIEGENAGEDALRDAKPMTISTQQFQTFLKRHSSVQQLVPESNTQMMNSYLILDENLCFLNCTKGGKEPNPSIRDVPISVALQSAGFDSEMFLERGGIYSWSRPVAQDPRRLLFLSLALGAIGALALARRK